MPVYVYRRRDGSSFELEQRITVDALVNCPTTGQSVQRVMQPFNPRYKGTGFYSTDHPKGHAKASGTDQGTPAETRSGRGFAADDQRHRLRAESYAAPPPLRGSSATCAIRR